MATRVTEPRAVNKPWKQQTKRLADVASACLSDSFARQGFARAELVTRWADIVGSEIAALAEPIKLQWQRTAPGEGEPATLVLRVEGPAAIEVQHLSNVILERVNRFMGWRAIDRLALRQAPLRRRFKPPPRLIDPAAAAEIATTLDKVDDESLRAALGRLGAAIKRS
jgi:hypothetical protein